MWHPNSSRGVGARRPGTRGRCAVRRVCGVLSGQRASRVVGHDGPVTFKLVRRGTRRVAGTRRIMLARRGCPRPHAARRRLPTTSWVDEALSAPQDGVVVRMLEEVMRRTSGKTECGVTGRGS